MRRLLLIVILVALGVLIGELAWVVITDNIRYSQPLNPVEYSHQR
jgi:hypothetical protein